MYVDTHVHIYPEYSLDRMIAGVFANLPHPSQPCTLMLTERRGDDMFSRLAEEDFAPIDDCTLKLSLSPYPDLYVVSGRQIATEERMEVLALGTRAEFDDGHSIRDSIQDVVSEGALPVIPWALGKWWGKRGQILQKLLDQPEPAFLLADSAMRPSLTPPSPFFQKAEQLGMPLLAGSDPLPRPEDETLAGRYGVRLERIPPEETFTADLVQSLRRGQFTRYGSRRGWLRMLRTIFL